MSWIKPAHSSALQSQASLKLQTRLLFGWTQAVWQKKTTLRKSFLRKYKCWHNFVKESCSVIIDCSWSPAPLLRCLSPHRVFYISIKVPIDVWMSQFPNAWPHTSPAENGLLETINWPKKNYPNAQNNGRQDCPFINLDLSCG